MVLAISSRRDQRVTLSPLWANAFEKAVPQLPAPTTATFSSSIRVALSFVTFFVSSREEELAARALLPSSLRVVLRSQPSQASIRISKLLGRLLVLCIPPGTWEGQVEPRSPCQIPV